MDLPEELIEREKERLEAHQNVMRARLRRIATNMRYPDLIDRIEAVGPKSTSHAAGVAVMRRVLGGLRGRKIVYMACRSGSLVHFLRTKCRAEAYGFDLSVKHIETGRRARIGGLSIGDARKVATYPARDCDAIYTQHFLQTEYVPPDNERAIIAQARQALRPGGLLLIDQSLHVLHNRYREGQVLDVVGLWTVIHAREHARDGLLVLRREE